MRATECAWAS